VPTVAVIGASRERHKYGNRAVRAYLRQGWTVYPINPNEREVEGIATFASVADVPGSIDRASLYVPAAVGITLLASIKQKQIAEVWVNPGAESDELIAEADRLGLNTVQACSIVDIGERP
jgi:predicted CoA-binding protein